jgi:hypothetical protein
MTALAHPTSSKGTVSIMGESSDSTNRFDVIYSYRHWLGLGARVQQQRLGNASTETALGTLGLLLYRDNGENHQANIYFQGGLGNTWFKNGDVTIDKDLAYMHSFQADYETRKIYTLLKYENLKTDNQVLSEMYEARAGFAPYVAGFYDLNSWFILQATLDKAVNNSIEVAPIVRFFYKNVLTEFGSTIDGKFIFNFMVHY